MNYSTDCLKNMCNDNNIPCSRLSKEEMIEELDKIGYFEDMIMTPPPIDHKNKDWKKEIKGSKR